MSNWKHMLDGDVLKAIGQSIKTLRKNQDMNQQQLADHIGISRVALSQLESGNNTSLVTLIRILKTFGRMDAFEQLFYVSTIQPKKLFEESQKKKKK